MRFGSCHQLAWAERLCNIIVGSLMEGTDFVDLLFLGRYDQNRNLLLLSDAVAQLVAAHSRKLQIDNNERVIALQSQLQSFVPE